MLTRFVQFILILIPFGLFFWLARIEFIPNGEFVVSHSVHDSSPYIDALAPQDRVQVPVKQNSQWWQAIVDDPVFFFLHPHRHFDQVGFEIWFQNTSVPIVEFGGLVQTKPDVYDLQPLHNLLIDQLHWPTISDGQLTLYQKTKQYDSLEAFYANPPARSQVAVYKTDYRAPFRFEEYLATNEIQTTEVSLRGTHEFKTYIKNETFDFRFEFMDMNRDEGADSVVVTLFNEQGKPVIDARVEDDGRIYGDAIPSAMRDIHLQVPGLVEGVYKVVFNASRDIFVRKIHTTQKKLIVLNHLFLGDEIAYRQQPLPKDIWSASKRFQMQTLHASGIQEVTRGSSVFSLAEPYKMYTFETDGKLGVYRIPKGDLEVFFDGPLSFSSEQYFQPDPVGLRSYTDLVSQGIAYVMTSYRPPKEVDGWLVQSVAFETSPLVFDKKSWKFTFSTPEIRQRGGEVRVKQINTTFIRPPFEWVDIWSKLFN